MKRSSVARKPLSVLLTSSDSTRSVQYKGAPRGALLLSAWWAAVALGLSACAPLHPAGGTAVLATPPGAEAHCIAEWQRYTLPGKRATSYSAGADAGRPALLARADRSASMLRHPTRIEPDALGQLSFSWRVRNLVEGGDVRERDSDDAPARLALSFSGAEARLPARDLMLFDLAEAVSGERPPFATLMYVWDAKTPVGQVVPNPRSDRVRKIVLESGAENLGQWRTYQRDIVADYTRVFGEPPGALVGIALMTDADNTSSQTTAAYGPVCLTPAPAKVAQPALAPEPPAR